MKHVLKSIALKKPQPGKPPIWNVDNLISSLETKVVDECNNFKTCRQAATLLLLYSGRRIHDLTLLCIDSNHFEENDDYLIFWPLFGSKTDSTNHKQSGWKLLAYKQNKNLDPVYWIKRTIINLKDRRMLAKSNSLFVSLRGEAKPASRSVIAGWVKSLLQEVGISATPGSFRSAVSSKSWLDKFSMEEIMARGNWKSSKTFQRFYQRQVMPASSSNNNNTLRLFQPID